MVIIQNACRIVQDKIASFSSPCSALTWCCWPWKITFLFGQSLGFSNWLEFLSQNLILLNKKQGSPRPSKLKVIKSMSHTFLCRRSSDIWHLDWCVQAAQVCRVTLQIILQKINIHHESNLKQKIFIIPIYIKKYICFWWGPVLMYQYPIFYHVFGACPFY